MGTLGSGVSSDNESGEETVRSPKAHAHCGITDDSTGGLGPSPLARVTQARPFARRRLSVWPRTRAVIGLRSEDSSAPTRYTGPSSGSRHLCALPSC